MNGLIDHLTPSMHKCAAPVSTNHASCQGAGKAACEVLRKAVSSPCRDDMVQYLGQVLGLGATVGWERSHPGVSPEAVVSGVSPHPECRRRRNLGCQCREAVAAGYWEQDTFRVATAVCPRPRAPLALDAR